MTKAYDTARAVQQEEAQRRLTYTGPEFYTVNAINERESRVTEYTTGRILGTYRHELAAKVAKLADAQALREYLKAQRKAAKAAK